MHEELERVRLLMQKKGYSPYLYEPYLDRLNNAISVDHIQANWVSVKQHFSGPEAILCLGFCYEIIDNEESDISKEDIEEINNLIKKSQSILENSQLPKAVIDILSKTINQLETAIRVIQ